jgi:hypothetical protein
MAAPNLPEPLINGLRELATLSDSVFGKFLEALASLPTEMTQRRVFPDFEFADLPDNGDSIKGATFSLFLTKASQRDTPQGTADQIISAVAPAVSLDKDKIEFLRQRITQILCINSLNLVAKAHDILVDHSCIYSNAKIFSDIRAVFGDNINEVPEAAVIVHTLNIGSRSAGKRQTISFALDEKDVEELINVLERARTKAATLREMIKRSGVKYIGIK